jgi:hypothetical protein
MCCNVSAESCLEAYQETRKMKPVITASQYIYNKPHAKTLDIKLTLVLLHRERIRILFGRALLAADYTS